MKIVFVPTFSESDENSAFDCEVRDFGKTYTAKRQMDNARNTWRLSQNKQRQRSWQMTRTLGSKLLYLNWPPSKRLVSSMFSCLKFTRNICSNQTSYPCWGQLLLSCIMDKRQMALWRRRADRPWKAFLKRFHRPCDTVEERFPNETPEPWTQQHALWMRFVMSSAFYLISISI